MTSKVTFLIATNYIEIFAPTRLFLAGPAATR